MNAAMRTGSTPFRIIAETAPCRSAWKLNRSRSRSRLEANLDGIRTLLEELVSRHPDDVEIAKAVNSFIESALA